jgi:hypothetical protein
MMHTTRSTRVTASITPAPLLGNGSWIQRCSCGTHDGGGECAECSKKKMLQRKAAAGPSPALAPPLVHQALQSSGSPLNAHTRHAMERPFGHDFGRVRVHTDQGAAESARAINAHAYTVGSHIVFGAGRYAPGTPAGNQLLAHELTHVVQQRGRADVSGPLRLGDSGSRCEAEADAMASRVGPAIGASAAGGYGGLMGRDRRRAFPGGSAGGAAGGASTSAPSGTTQVGPIGSRPARASGAREWIAVSDDRVMRFPFDRPFAVQERGKPWQRFRAIDDGQALGAAVGPYPTPAANP